MSNFPLTIVTPDGCVFDGETNRVTVRTTDGEVTILGHHINYVAAIGMGPAVINIDGENKKACCIGGMLSMINNVCRVVATSFEWQDAIDVERAERALKRAEYALSKVDPSKKDEVAAFTAAKRRAMVRLSLAKSK